MAITARQMPVYLQLAANQRIEAPRIDLGANLAGGATLNYSAKCVNLDRINNGVWETYQSGGPHGDTDGKDLFCGELPTAPQMLDITLAESRPITAVLVAGLRADNTFCARLDYDIQYDKDIGRQHRTTSEPHGPESHAATGRCREN